MRSLTCSPISTLLEDVKRSGASPAGKRCRLFGARLANASSLEDPCSYTAHGEELRFLRRRRSPMVKCQHNHAIGVYPESLAELNYERYHLPCEKEER